MTSVHVGLIGHGAVGAAVADALSAGHVPGAELTGVCSRTPDRAVDRPWMGFDELATRSDLVIECAGHEAVAEFGVAALTVGCDLLVVSLGALVDDDLLARLRTARPGRLRLSTGAIGGLDLVGAVSRAGPLDHVRLTSVKQPGPLVQPWMSEDLVDRLRTAARPVTVFDGPARDAARCFPRSANVAAALALAVGRWDGVTARIVADQSTHQTRHEIDLRGATGEYRIEIRNKPSPDNPASSALVSHAILRAIADHTGSNWRFQ